MTWSLVYVTGLEKRHPWVERYSQTSWEPANYNNNILKTKIKGNEEQTDIFWNCTLNLQS